MGRNMLNSYQARNHLSGQKLIDTDNQEEALKGGRARSCSSGWLGLIGKRIEVWSEEEPLLELSHKRAVYETLVLLLDNVNN